MIRILAFTPARLAFLGAFAVAMLFALFTQHVWEDYYITYRSSKNLATGHGLVFNHGDKLHTFTSPIGVLLPTLASGLTGNSSDTGALWIFRVMCATALGGAAALMTLLTQRLRFPGWAAILAVAWFVTDAKVLDFTINGMETAFMLLFLVYAFWAQLRSDSRQWIHLGIAWAGLMWTRPDSFIYVALIAGGFWIFNDAIASGRSRREWFIVYLKAGLLTTALYLPWLAWSAWYYGTPVPHTITAKSSFGGARTLFGLLLTAVKLPYLAWKSGSSIEHTYLPSYFMIGQETWPTLLIYAARGLAATACLLWFIPGIGLAARVASFIFFGAHVYLSYFPYFPFPWYIPNAAVFGTLALAGALARVLELASRYSSRVLQSMGAVAVIVLLGGASWTTWQVARQMRAQQQLIETGNRRQIGEWLKEQSSPGDTVFMEPLGYIGYFSGLKTFDFPGMSSREMVEARKIVGVDWALLIQYLQPTWVVLRPFEIGRVSQTSRLLLTDNYKLVREFDTMEAVRRTDVRGRPYLEHDARFSVFKLHRPTRYETEFASISGPFGMSEATVDNIGVVMVHAPSSVVVPVPAAARRFSLHFGFLPGATENPTATDGATFLIEFSNGGERREFLRRTLTPTTVEGDRGLHEVFFDLPESRAPNSVLILRTEILASMDKDWTCWTRPTFR